MNRRIACPLATATLPFPAELKFLVLSAFLLAAFQPCRAQVKNIVFAGIEVSATEKINPVFPAQKEVINQQYILQRQDFSSRTPAYGIGLIKRKGIGFLKASIFYWSGIKNFGYELRYLTGHSDYSVRTEESTPRDGAVYFRVQESSLGKLHLHYADLELSGGINLNRFLSLMLGIKRFALAHHSYNGILDQNVEQLKFNSSTNSFSLISDKKYRLHDNELKNRNGQILQGSTYLSAGVHVKYVLLKRENFVQVNFQYPLSTPFYSPRVFVALQAGWTFAGKS